MLFGLRHALRHPALASSVRGLLIVCGAEMVLFGIVFTLGWLASRASPEQLLLKWRPRRWVVPLGIGYSVAMRFAVGIIIATVVSLLVGTGLLHQENVQRFLADSRPAAGKIVDLHAIQHDPVYFWLTLTLSSFVVAGLREEMWRAGTFAALRTLWPRTFGSQPGQVAAVALIAIIFGLAHLGLGLLPAVSASLLGFFLGVIMITHQSIWPAVVAHGMFDATTFALLPFLLRQT
jgi:membrane protease YdiL (CAAX protease family)